MGVIIHIEEESGKGSGYARGTQSGSKRDRALCRFGSSLHGQFPMPPARMDGRTSRK